jgi:microcystin degradation protein MlrC
MRILIGGCQQEISTFNPVPCEYEFFDYLRGDEIRATHDGNDSQIGGALAELKSAFGDDLEVVKDCGFLCKQEVNLYNKNGDM